MQGREFKQQEKMLFQFHKGAIKSVTHLQKCTTIFAFQFHKGAIKSLHYFANWKLNQNGFNSIKVRLKADWSVSSAKSAVVSIP